MKSGQDDSDGWEVWNITISYVVIASFLCVYLLSYAPKKELQSYTTPIEDAPSGLLYRGNYTVSSLFTDDDQNEHLKVRIPHNFLQFDYNFTLFFRFFLIVGMGIWDKKGLELKITNKKRPYKIEETHSCDYWSLTFWNCRSFFARVNIPCYVLKVVSLLNLFAFFSGWSIIAQIHSPLFPLFFKLLISWSFSLPSHRVSSEPYFLSSPHTSQPWSIIISISLILL